MKITPQDIKQEFFKKVSTTFHMSKFAAEKYFNEGTVLVFDRYSLMEFYHETWPEYSRTKHETMIEEDLQDGRHLRQISSNVFVWLD